MLISWGISSIAVLRMMRPMRVTRRSSFADRTGPVCFSASLRILYGDYLGVEGAEVLDVGAGLGVQSCIFALLGARKVTSYDVTPECHDGERHLLSAFHPPLPVEPVLADWVSNPAPPNSADAVLMQESLSHIRDTDKAIRSAVGALRPGGRLVISDANNSFWPPNIVNSLLTYRRSEYGQGSSDPNARAADRKGAYEARKEIIGGAIPGLSDETLSRLARKTRGLYGNDLLTATRELHATGRTQIRPDFPYRNPYTGEFPELLMSPIRLWRQLTRLGLKCEFLPQPRTWLGGRKLHPVDIAKRLLAAGASYGPGCSRPFFGRVVVIRGTKAKEGGG